MSESTEILQQSTSPEERKVVLGANGYETHVYRNGKLLYIDDFDRRKDLPPDIIKVFPVNEGPITPTPVDRAEGETEKAARINDLEAQRDMARRKINERNQPAKNLYRLELIKSD